MNNFYKPILATHVFLLIIIANLLIFNSCTFSPVRMIGEMFEKPDSCDIYISDYKLLKKIYSEEFVKYNFQPGEIIADIGAGNLFFELANLCFQEGLTFYVQDINMVCLTEEALQKGKEHFTKLRGEGPLKGNIFIVKGDTNQSNLPKNFFDKVILRMVYHELKNPELNLKDIYEILKDDGALYIGETLEKKENKMKKCGLHRTQENLIREIENSGFKLDQIVHEDKKVNYKVFKFSKKKL